MLNKYDEQIKDLLEKQKAINIDYNHCDKILDVLSKFSRPDKRRVVIYFDPHNDGCICIESASKKHSDRDSIYELVKGIGFDDTMKLLIDDVLYKFINNLTFLFSINIKTRTCTKKVYDEDLGISKTIVSSIDY